MIFGQQWRQTFAAQDFRVWYVSYKAFDAGNKQYVYVCRFDVCVGLNQTYYEVHVRGDVARYHTIALT